MVEIPRDVASSEGVPDDLDSASVGPYQFPSPRRRRIAGSLYLGAAALMALGAAVGLPTGLWIAAGGLVLLASYHFATAWKVTIDERAALQTAGSSVDFAVGHASAALRFEGFLSRPVWSVILYSASEPPTKRALVRIDARSSTLRAEPYVEEIETP
ncbi:MAG: hypothetical protein ACE5MI_03280 [Acidimicrobiia bacterium]